MITCLALDDEPLALKQLQGFIKKTPFLELTAGCHSVAEAEAVLAEKSVDVIITDINMPDISGLQFVKSLTNPPLVVFSTAYEDYAVEAFKVDAIDYLLKPYGYQDFLKAAVKVRQYLELKKNAETTSSAEGDDSNYIFVRADNKSVKVRLDDIFFIEAMSEYVKIHFKDGSSIMTFMSIKLMVDSLPASRFMRVHRSYIVALEVIDNMHRSEIVLSDGTILPVSASYKEDLQHYIDTHSVIRKPIH